MNNLSEIIEPNRREILQSAPQPSTRSEVAFDRNSVTGEGQFHSVGPRMPHPDLNLSAPIVNPVEIELRVQMPYRQPNYLQ